MDKDFDLVNARAHAQKQEENFKDFNNELAGRDTGRIKRFGVGDDKDVIEAKKKQEKETLEQLLMSEIYRQAYNSTINALYDAQEAVNTAMSEATKNLQQSQKAYDDMLARASELPDGTKVFLDDDGAAYTLDGSKLNDDQMLSVDWREDSDSRSVAIDKSQSLEQDKQRYDEVMGVQNRLNDINADIHDNDQSFSVEELQNLEAEARAIEQRYGDAQTQKVAYEAEEPTHKSLPSLDMNF